MNSERDAPHLTTGLPEVSPDVARAYFEHPHDTQEIFAQLYGADRTAATAVMRAIGLKGRHHEASGTLEIDDPEKHAFVEGALFMYNLLKHSQEAEALNALFLQSTDDASDDEAPPP